VPPLSRSEVLRILHDPSHPWLDDAVDRALALRLRRAVPLLLRLIVLGRETGRLGLAVGEVARGPHVKEVRRIAASEGPGADEALYALNCRMSSSDVPVLVHVLRTSPVASRRDRAADALGDAFDVRRGRAYRFREAEQALIDGLADPDPYVRYTCALSLSKLRSRKALPTLDRLAAEDHVRGVTYADRTVADMAAEAAANIRRSLPPSVTGRGVT
jgi:HEAT repeat protein